MRNGVLAITRDGRARGHERGGLPHPRARAAGPTTSGAPFADVLASQPDIVRILGGGVRPGAPAEPRRAAAEAVGQGDRLHAVARPRRRAASRTGAALFFKDLTRVEQLEERERLRDRLAALGEMAAAIAHEVKNPLAGIEVMAGLLRRRMPDVAGRAVAAERHHQRSEDGQRHRPRGARVRAADPAAGRAHVDRRRCCTTRSTMAERKVDRGDVDVALDIQRAAAADPGRPPPAVPAVHATC